MHFTTLYSAQASTSLLHCCVLLPGLFSPDIWPPIAGLPSLSRYLAAAGAGLRSSDL